VVVRDTTIVGGGSERHYNSGGVVVRDPTIVGGW
jgi:hypothetical protein